MNIGRGEGRLKAALIAFQDHLPGFQHPIGASMEHLRETIHWIYRAQDATADDGVSRGYALTRGWYASYPETTGYIIPTLFDYWHLTGDVEARDRARRMADWEISIQLPDGGVRAGLVDAPRAVATVFNTGQVIFGWARAYRELGEVPYRAACERAAEWLVRAQDADGEWRTGGSPLVSTHTVNTYNARAAWALLEAHAILRNDTYQQAALRNIEGVVRKQHPNGWFPEACLSDNARPLLHTIAYTIEGILNAGTMLGREDLLKAAVLATDGVLGSMRRDGSIPGRLDSAWRGTTRWVCITGVAQMAVICFWLHDATGVERYLDAGRRLNAFLKTTQDIRTSNLSIRGGMKGSHPHTGGYCPFDYLNWPAKFFADALMLELQRETPVQS